MAMDRGHCLLLIENSGLECVILSCCGTGSAHALSEDRIFLSRRGVSSLVDLRGDFYLYLYPQPKTRT